MTLEQIDQAYQTWRRASLLVEALDENSSISTEEIAAALNAEKKAFQDYQAALFTAFNGANDVNIHHRRSK